MDAVVQHPRPTHVHLTAAMESRLDKQDWPPLSWPGLRDAVSARGIRAIADTFFGAKPVWDAHQFMVT